MSLLNVRFKCEVNHVRLCGISCSSNEHKTSRRRGTETSERWLIAICVTPTTKIALYAATVGRNAQLLLQTCSTHTLRPLHIQWFIDRQYFLWLPVASVIFVRPSLTVQLSRHHIRVLSSDQSWQLSWVGRSNHDFRDVSGRCALQIDLLTYARRSDVRERTTK